LKTDLKTDKEDHMAQATPGSNYTIQQGDTLSSIAQQAYGDSNQWEVISNANNITDPNLIYAGQVLYIPTLTSASPTPGSNYTVQQGDTLSEIAQKAYGDANQWQTIYNYPANKQVIGSNPNVLRPGEVLFIPPVTLNKTCTVTSPAGLNARAAATSQSAKINSFSPGTVLSFFEVVIGENVQGNPRWGHSNQGYYFWLGGTDHPNG
jgi:LysM repeat protein